ncbi:terminase large subunit [Clostridium sp. 19966]|nr:terminase large subunit [Clostridium sp. 19966]
MYSTVLEELIEYSNEVIKGRILACKRHKQACERFLKDLEKMELDSWNYYWDEEEAQRIVKWYSYCKHSKGPLEGKPIELNNWQKFVVCNIEAWKCKDSDYRRFRFAFIQVGRKNSKSQLEAGMAAYECGAKGHNAAEIYTLGVEREQAKIVFDEVNLMLSKPLKKRFKIVQKEIRHKKSNSFIKHLSQKAGKTGDGKNPQMAIVDEYHAHRDSRMYDVMKSGMISRQEPLLVIITTAGEDYEETPCYYEYQDCCSILDGIIDNDRYFVMICELEKEDNPYDEKNWIKANPVAATYKEGIESIKELMVLAKDSSNEKKKIDFLTKNCNIYVAAGENKYVDIEYWKKCRRDISLEDFRGRTCNVGADLSKTGDLTSNTFEFDFMDNDVLKYAVFSHSYIPEAVVSEKSKTDNVPYDLWIRRGWLTKTTANDGLIIDYMEMVNYIESIVEKYNLKRGKLGYDQHYANFFIAEMEKRGWECVKVPQSCAKLDNATVSFRDLLKVQRIVHDGNKLFTWSLNNCEVDKNSFGEIKLSKKGKFKRIDPVASAIFSHEMFISELNNKSVDVSKYAGDEYLNKLWS